jgi:hypothetical protein
MRVYHFSEHPYPNAWDDPHGYLRVNLPNRALDPKIAADLFHRYHDEYLLADELGLDLMLNEHHQTAPMNATSIVACRSWRVRASARILILASPIGHRPDLRRRGVANIDVVRAGASTWASRQKPYEFAPSNANPVGVMDRSESHDFIIKAMTTHTVRSTGGRALHYRQVNLWPAMAAATSASGSTTASKSNARVLGERGRDRGARLGATTPACFMIPIVRVTPRPTMARCRPRSLRLSGAVCDRITKPRHAGAGELGRYLRTANVYPPLTSAWLFLGRRYGTADARLHAGAPVHQGQAWSTCALRACRTDDPVLMVCGTPDQCYAQITDFIEYTGGPETF